MQLPVSGVTVRGGQVTMQGQLPRIKQIIIRCRRVGKLTDTLRVLEFM